MIQERNPRLQAHRHSCPIDLAQDVVRQIADGIAIHHSYRVAGASFHAHIKSCGVAIAKHGIHILAPFIQEVQVDIVNC
jgi:hypothetical protein